jgi:DNA polymerase delta subunit 2
MTVAVAISTETCPKRAFCSHQPKWQRFQPTLMKSETKNAAQNEKETFQYQRQYSHVYSQRLTALRPRCWKSFETIAPAAEEYTRTNRVLELREDVPSRIVGTLVKETTDKDEATIGTTKCRPSDVLFLEDESGRVALNIRNPHQYCTGIVVGIQGKVDRQGVFHVNILVLPTLAPPPNVTGVSLVSASLSGAPDDTDTKVAPHLLLVSSLLCGDANVPSVPREMLLSYLQGQFTQDAAKVCRVLVLGGGPSSQEPLLGVKELDAFLLQLTKAGIPVDIMPGKHDPTTANWPQRPLHPSLLPHATAMVHRTPNPYAAALGPHWIVATDGANVQDLQHYATTDNGDVPARLTDIQALMRTLEWSHICPTGPDSMPTVPHMEQDPMVLESQPHLYVSGNADHFATATLNGTTLLCVPKFSETGEAVLVNLETLGVERLRFQEE